MTDDLHRAAAAAAVLGSDQNHGALLQSIADVARALFRAEAATIFLLDDAGMELVFVAVSGSGERDLIGSRVPAGTGIAGWALSTREAIAVDDTASDPRFARSTAESIGYVPSALVAVPILREDTAVGVLQVLDPGLGRRVGQGDLTLLSLFAAQAAIALDLVRQARAAGAAAAGLDGPAAATARLASAVAQRPDAEAWGPVLDALATALETPPS
jgi:GAF domain-containing protein